MDRAFRSPSPLMLFAIVALIAVTTGGCGGGDDHPKVAPATVPSVTVPAAVEPTGTVTKQGAGLGHKAKTSQSSNPPGEDSSKSSAVKAGTATLPSQGVEVGPQRGSSGKASAANRPSNGTDPSPLPTGPGPQGAHNGVQ